MEDQPKVITKEEVLERLDKLGAKTRFAVEFSGYRLSAVFCGENKDYGIRVDLLLGFGLEKSRELRNSDPGANYYRIKGANLSICELYISSLKDEERIFDQFQDGRKILALFREIAANYTALIQHT
jgi:hypothetical protein